MSGRLAVREAPVLPGGVLVAGHLPALRKDILGFLTRVRDEAGDVVRVKLGVRQALILASPTAVERVIVENQRNYNKQSRGYQMLRLMLGDGLVTSEGDLWLRQRRLMQPAFHRERIAALEPLIVRATEDLCARWERDVIPSGRGFDLAHDMMSLTMRIIAEALFSVDVSGESDEAGAAINELVHQAVARTTSLSPFPLWVPTPMNVRFARGKRTLDTLVFSIIEGRRRGEDKPDLLSLLLHAVDEETGERMSDAQLRDEVLTLFAAGHETTSNLLSWTLWLLMQHDDVLTRLRDELDALPAGARLDALLQLPLLDAVLKESMRLYPPIPLITRACVADDALDGFAAHAGDFVFCPQWSVHRHPKLWRDPDRFDPTRFLAPDDARPRYAFFPFLGGPRKCIGDQLSLLEAKLILRTLLLRFRFSPAPGPPVVPEATISLRPREGLFVHVARR